MRMLFTSTGGFGSFHPLAALAIAARDAGHDVAFATAGDRRATVEALGLGFFDTGAGVNEVRRLMRERHPDLPVPPTDEATRRRVLPAFFGGVYVESMLAGLVEACRSWRPHVLIRAHLAYAGWLAAEACGIPHVTVEEYASGDPGWTRANLSDALNAWRAILGLEADPALEGIDRHLVLVPFPESLRHSAAPLPATARRMRPLIFNESGWGGSAEWLASLQDGPIVHASLGTVAVRPELLRAIIDAVAGESYTAIIATGPRTDPAHFGPLPANVRALEYVSHDQLLPRCAAIITHAGAGTLIASVSAGLPMVLVPLFGDQHPNAERAAAAGAGIVLDHASLTPEILRRKTRSVLNEPRYRDAAKALRGEAERLPPHAEAVRWIAQVARGNEAPAHS